MQARKIIVAVAAMLLSAVAARAAIAIDTVHVDDAGNVADTAAHSGNPNGQGSVAYEYNIGKYEVTAGQYGAFLNAVAQTDTNGLYDSSMSDTSLGSGITQSGSSGSYSYTVAADFVSRPVSYVSFWDSCRFANWLQNGQPTGDQGPGTTETGTYTLNGYNGYGPEGAAIQRNPDSTWAVTSEDEWYKAAYYKGGSKNAGYWLYPTRSDSAPGQDMNDASGNNANYYTGSGPFPFDNDHYTTLVGEFQNSPSPYGTFDQGGNVWEWNEGILDQDSTFARRGLRGGAYRGVNHDSYEYSLQSLDRDDFFFLPMEETGRVGFRVSEVPEPATLSMLALGGIAMLRRRKMGL